MGESFTRFSRKSDDDVASDGVVWEDSEKTYAIIVVVAFFLSLRHHRITQLGLVVSGERESISYVRRPARINRRLRRRLFGLEII